MQAAEDETEDPTGGDGDHVRTIPGQQAEVRRVSSRCDQTGQRD